MDLYIGTTASKIYLNGSSIAAPVTGGGFSPVKAGGGVATRAPTANEWIEEVITVNLFATAAAPIDTWMLNLELMFASARLWYARRLGGTAGMVSLGCQVDTADGYYLSPVADGWIEQMGGGPADSSAGGLAVRIHVVRCNWWEKAVVTLLPLTNSQGASVTTGLQVYNHNDAGHASYVEIAAAAIGGSLPARTLILFTNTVNDGLSLRNLYISQNVFSAPATLNLILEGDDGTGGTKTADANCSKGYYQLIAWSGVAATLLEYWTIAGADVDKFAGSECHAVARLQAVHAYADLWYQWQVQIGATVLWSSPWMLGIAGQALQELPMLRIPPWFLSNAIASKSLKLCLYARRDAGGSCEIDLDFIQLMPQDGYRRLSAVYPIPYNFAVQDDGWNGIIETINYNGGAGALATHVGSGAQIMLRPGLLQRIYFLHDCDDGSAGIARTGTVVMMYWPRVRSF